MKTIKAAVVIRDGKPICAVGESVPLLWSHAQAAAFVEVEPGNCKVVEVEISEVKRAS